MPDISSGPSETKSVVNRWWLLPLLLGVVLAFLFSRSFEKNQILFSNDGPLGQATATENQLAGRFTGTWRPLNWLGGEGPAAAPTVTNILLSVLSPVMAQKIYPPFTLLFLGFSAWLFFRQLRFNPLVCVLGGIAAALNAHFLSVACWGQGSWDIAAGMVFLSMAALVSPSIKQIWAKAALAGLAVGMTVMEGFDLGVILSVYCGFFVLFYAFTGDEPMGKKVVKAIYSETVVIAFAVFIAIYSILTLVGTQVTGVTGMNQDEASKEDRWPRATQWSLPKLETFQIFVPGLFGYRMAANIGETDRSSAYWGKIGEDPTLPALLGNDPVARGKVLDQFNVPPDRRRDIEGNDPQKKAAAIEAGLQASAISRRFTGNSEYGGILITLLAVFGIVGVCRKNDGVLSRSETLIAWFWGGAALFSLLTAWGRFGFIYRLLYYLPGFSTIRNPTKFMHPFHIAWVILAAYGMEILYRRYMRGNGSSSDALPTHLQRWWKKAAGFEKKWVVGLGLLLVVSIAALLLFSASKVDLAVYLQNNGFPMQAAKDMADFSCGQLVRFVILLFLCVVTIAGILSGKWMGPQAKWAWMFLGVILVIDLGRVDGRWIHYLDYVEKYTSNPVTDFLMEKPHEHRVIGKFEPFGPGSGITPGLGPLYYFWLQNDFPYHDIQSLDFAQMPRTPALDRAFSTPLYLKGTDVRGMSLFPAVRLWQLTNTRYILGPTAVLNQLNESGDATYHSIRILSQLNMTRKSEASALLDYGDATVVRVPKGPYALFEYPHALPRARLYSHWESPTNDEAIMETLSSPSFDPEKSVIVSKETPVTQEPGDAQTDAGSVTITDYKPKKVTMQASAKTPSVLLLNDRMASAWHVYVDNQSAPVLRCNFIMRGVFLKPGEHAVEFRFEPSLTPLFVSVAAILSGVLIAGFLIMGARAARPKETPTPKPTTPPPVEVSVKATPNRKAKMAGKRG